MDRADVVVGGARRGSTAQAAHAGRGGAGGGRYFESNFVMDVLRVADLPRRQEMSARKVGKKRWNVTGRVLGGGRRTRAVRLGGAERNRTDAFRTLGRPHLQRLRRTVQTRAPAAAASGAPQQQPVRQASRQSCPWPARPTWPGCPDWPACPSSGWAEELAARAQIGSAATPAEIPATAAAGAMTASKQRLHGDRIGRDQRYPGARARLQFHGPGI